jgi:PAS domain S-box-containing protein
MAVRKSPPSLTTRRARPAAASLRNGNGKGTALRALHDEIHTLRTEVERLETSQHETELYRERLAHLHDFGPVGCVILNRQGHVTDLNFSAAALLRRTRQSLVDLPFAVCIERTWLREYLDHLHRCREQQSSVITDLEVRRPDGHLVPVRLTTRPVTSYREAGQMLFQTCLLDLTEQKAVETVLQDRDEHLRMALRCANAGVWTIELAAARKVSWSPEFYHLLGLQPDRVLPSVEAFLNVLHPGDRLRAEKGLKTALAGEIEDFQGEYRIRRTSGVVRWLGLFGRIALGRNQQPHRIAGIGIDITAQKEAEQQLRQAHETLDQRVKERTAHLRALTATLEQEIADRRRLERQILEISEREQRRIGQDLHDGLGQQITGIIFHAHLLHKHLAGKSAKEAESAAQIVTLLDQAKVQARQIARGLQPVDPSPNGLMAGLGHFATTTRKLYHIHCRFDCPEPVLIEDYNAATHLFRIAQEAVANAFRHGGASAIEIRLRRADGILTLEISDNGRGLPKRARRKGGLGLRFMQYRAEVMGGTLDVRRRPRGGTIVRCEVRTDGGSNED